MRKSATPTVILDRHTEDAAFTWLTRNNAIKDPHYDLKDLAELDSQLAANLDGLQVAGEAGWQAAAAALEADREPGETFAAAWLAIAMMDKEKFDWVLDAAREDPENFQALASAFGWHPLEKVNRWVSAFFHSQDPHYTLLGISACAIGRSDPGEQLCKLLAWDDERILVRSIRAIGELGRRDLLKNLAPFRTSHVTALHFWSNWSALLLGDISAQSAIAQYLTDDSGYAWRALQLVARTLESNALDRVLTALAEDENTLRLASIGAGYGGYAERIPGLINYMQIPALSRVAGEAFSMITGVDLAYEDLDRDEPEGFTSGPNDDPEDDDVDMDEDGFLPWPNPELLAEWWQKNAQKFQPQTRYLCGQPIAQAHCQAILRTGYQRQRSAAAMELALMGQPFYETRAPGFQQLRQLN